MPVLLLWALVLAPAAPPIQAETALVETTNARQEIRFSSHALERMAERGVTREQVLKVVQTAAPFRYFHQGQWKTGYFDAASGLFVASAGGVVITVFTDATPRYVERLKRGEGDTDNDKRYRGLIPLLGDPLPYGMKANRASIDALMTYALQQKLIPERMPLEQVFFDPEAL